MYGYQRILMTVRVVTLLLGVAFLMSRAHPSPAQVQDQSKFRIETVLTERAPTFTVTNLYSKTLTAAHFRFSSSAGPGPVAETVWDPLRQGWDSFRPQPPGPLEPGTDMTMYLAHIVGAPPSDQVEVVAGVWADGETFGDPSELKLILNHRAALPASYEQTIAIVQRGLDENWNRNQYLQGLRGVQNSAAVRFVVDALRKNNNPNPDPASIKSAIQSVLMTLKHNLDMLRPANPHSFAH
jgi:hypothetical protein